ITLSTEPLTVPLGLQLRFAVRPLGQNSRSLVVPCGLGSTTLFTPERIRSQTRPLSALTAQFTK
ncbi:MAG: hypothetical protein ACR2NF_03625, partial [Pirellulales bacterium]